MNLATITKILSEQLGEYAVALVAAVPRMVAALLILIFTGLFVVLARYIIRRIGQKAGMRNNMVGVLRMLAAVGFWIIGILIALTVLFPSITPDKALATLGLGSVVIGFAFKDTFENFLAGALILFREPFAIGDYVECQDVEGQVEDITIRDSYIRQTDGQLVVMPNHDLFDNPVTVRTNRDLRRTTIMCGVGYGENVDEARAVIQAAVENVDTVRSDVKDVQVFANGFGESSIDFEVTWWTGSTPLDIRASRDQVVAAVKNALDQAGIEIPFPQRTLTFPRPVAVAATAMVDAKATG